MSDRNPHIILKLGRSEGTSNYNALNNKPKINEIIVEGEKDGKDYSLQNLLIPGEGIEIEDNEDHTATIRATGSSISSVVFVATYGVTTAEEIIAYIESGNEAFAPILVKRGADYYTAILVAKSEDKAILRVVSSGGGDFHIFTYTVTNNIWTNSGYTIQKKLVSGMDLKTLNSESLLGSGNIQIAINGIPLKGDKSIEDLGINNITNQEILDMFNRVFN